MGKRKTKLETVLENVGAELVRPLDKETDVTSKEPKYYRVIIEDLDYEYPKHSNLFFSIRLPYGKYYFKQIHFGRKKLMGKFTLVFGEELITYKYIKINKKSLDKLYEDFQIKVEEHRKQHAQEQEGRTKNN